jgi:hypothetical protein
METRVESEIDGAASALAQIGQLNWSDGGVRVNGKDPKDDWCLFVVDGKAN